MNRQKTHRGLRLHVREDFRRTCAYCLLEEEWAGGVENFEVDHFRPQSIFPDLTLDFYNLYWSCHVCNRYKRAVWPSAALRKAGVGFVDLCASPFEEHYEASPAGILLPKSLQARYTIDILRLNRPHVTLIRRRREEWSR